MLMNPSDDCIVSPWRPHRKSDFGHRMGIVNSWEGKCNRGIIVALQNYNNINCLINKLLNRYKIVSS